MPDIVYVLHLSKFPLYMSRRDRIQLIVLRRRERLLQDIIAG